MRTGARGHLRRTAATVAAMLATTFATHALADGLPELECLIEPYVVIDIGSPTHGIVDTLAVDRSDVVQRNDVLAKLDSSQQNAAVRKAKARAAMESEIHTREAELALAERKQERMRELYNSDAISSHARDEVETELKRAQMQLHQARDARQLARIELDRARDDLKRRTIRSPIAGVIVERFVAPGEYVNEKPLMRLAQLHPLRIEAIAPATLFGEIKPGMQAQVATAEGGAQVHSATVTIVDKMIDAASGTFGIRLELPNPEYAIPSGLNCRLQVLANTTVPARSAAVQPEAKTAPSSRSAAVKPEAKTAPSSRSAAVKPETKTAPSSRSAAVKPETKTAPSSRSAAVKPETKTVPSSRSAAVQPEPTAQQPETTSDTQPETSPAVCRTFGPFADAAARNALAKELSDIATAVRTRDKSIEVPAGYLVLTSKSESIEDARRVAADLTARGAGDLVVLTKGAYAGSVSLGWFRDEQNAVDRQQTLNKIGVETLMQERLKPATQLWLDAEVQTAALQLAPWLQKIAAINASACNPEDYVAEEGIGLARTTQ